MGEKDYAVNQNLEFEGENPEIPAHDDIPAPNRRPGANGQKWPEGNALIAGGFAPENGKKYRGR